MDKATTTSIFVGNIPFKFTEDDIEDTFKPFGPLKSFMVGMDRNTGRSRGFGFVTFEARADAERAFERYQLTLHILTLLLFVKACASLYFTFGDLAA